VNNSPALPPAERFARIMRNVAEALAAQQKEGRFVGPLLVLAWNRLCSTGARVMALAAAYYAGTLRLRPARERPFRPRHRAPPAAPGAAAPPAPDKPKLPSGFGWLLGRARVTFGRSQMEYLLAQPDMQDLIAAVPPIAHHLRPVCRMLGVKPPPGLFPPRRSPRRPPRETLAPEPPALPREAATETPPPKPQPPPRPGIPLFVRPPPRARRRRRPVSFFPLKTT
jgi:hypothetical protein